ncbi:hypothetical protein Tco_0616540 [Tanacetum coccineum]
MSNWAKRLQIQTTLGSKMLLNAARSLESSEMQEQSSLLCRGKRRLPMFDDDMDVHLSRNDLGTQCLVHIFEADECDASTSNIPIYDEAECAPSYDSDNPFEVPRSDDLCRPYGLSSSMMYTNSFAVLTQSERHLHVNEIDESKSSIAEASACFTNQWMLNNGVSNSSLLTAAMQIYLDSSSGARIVPSVLQWIAFLPEQPLGLES